MRTVKKVVKKLPNTKIKDEQFQPHFYDDWNETSIIELKRFFEEESTEDNSFDLSYIETPNTKYKIVFHLNQLLYCCGIIEIGSLILDNNIPKEVYDKLFKTMLKAYGTTFMINTNGLTDSKRLEEYLVNSEYFTLVKEFKNPNTNNTIKIWISNN